MPDAEHSLGNTQEPPRQRRWLRRIAWGVGAAVLLLPVLIVVVPALLPASFVGRIVARQMSRALGRDVTVEGASVNVFTGLRAWRICVRERAGFGDEDFVRIAELRVGPPRFSTITISDGADVSLVRNEQGLLNTQDLAERPAGDFRFSRLAVANVRVRYADLASGGKATVTLSSVEVGPAARGKRSLRIGSRVATGGTVMLFGDLWVTPADEPDKLKAKLAVQSLALGRLAASLAPGRPVAPALRSAMLDADLDIEILWERILRGAGTLKLSGLPEVPQIGLAGPEAAVEAVLSGELSAFKPHFTLKAFTTPHAQAHLDASLKQIVADGSVPSFSMDNYLLDVALGAKADFSKGGLPGTALAAGEGMLTAHLFGTMAKATVLASASLHSASVTPQPSVGSVVPPMSFQLDSEFSLKDLTAQLHRLTFETEGVHLNATAHARPADGVKAEVGCDGSLPPMTGEATAEADVDFAKWPDGLRVLAGLPRGKPRAGTVKATERTTFDGGGRHELRVDVSGVPVDQELADAARLPFFNVIRAMMGGRPQAMDFAASLGAGLAATGLTPGAVASSLKGQGEARLEWLHVVGAPIACLMAGWAGRPEFRDLTFERATAPFTMASSRVKCMATVPRDGGAFVFRGEAGPGGELNFLMEVKNPGAVALIPKDVVDYLAAGQPMMYVTGTVDEPVARIPVEAILAFQLKQRLGKDLQKPPAPK